MFLSFYHFISYLLPANIYVHIVVREISILVSVCGTYIIYFWFEKFRISSSGCKYLVLFKLWPVYVFGLLWSVRLGWDCPVPKCSSKCVRCKICICVGNLCPAFGHKFYIGNELLVTVLFSALLFHDPNEIEDGSGPWWYELSNPWVFRDGIMLNGLGLRLANADSVRISLVELQYH